MRSKGAVNLRVCLLLVQMEDTAYSGCFLDSGFSFQPDPILCPSLLASLTSQISVHISMAHLCRHLYGMKCWKLGIPPSQPASFWVDLNDFRNLKGSQTHFLNAEVAIIRATVDETAREECLSKVIFQMWTNTTFKSL